MSARDPFLATVWTVKEGEIMRERRYVQPPPAFPSIPEQIGGTFSPDGVSLAFVRPDQPKDIRVKPWVATPNQAAIIKALAEFGPMKAPVLYDRSGIAKPSAWTALYGLIDVGVVRRSGPKGASLYSLVADE